MRTIRIKVCKFSELSAEAKQKAIEDYKNLGFDFAWSNEAYDSLRLFCERFNITFKSASFNEYAEVYYRLHEIDDTILNLSGLRLRTWLINNHYDLLYKQKTFGDYTKNAAGKWSYKMYSKCQMVETECPFTGYAMDADIIQPIKDFVKSPAKGTTLEDLINDCISAWIKSAKTDCEYQLSDEYIIEHFEANDYEFTQDGKMY